MGPFVYEIELTEEMPNGRLNTEIFASLVQQYDTEPNNR